MILASINMVNSDRIDTKFCHQSSIELTLGRVDKRVIGDQLVRDACDRRLVSLSPEDLKATLPLMKNWLPSLVKNFEPTAEIVGMAVTVESRATRPHSSGNIAPNMLYAEFMLMRKLWV